MRFRHLAVSFLVIAYLCSASEVAWCAPCGHELPGISCSSSAAPLNVVLIGDAIVQAEQIRRAASPGTIAIVYQSDSMTVAGLTDLLGSVSAAHNGALIEHLGIVAHGRPGAIDIGKHERLTLTTMPPQAGALQRLRSVLAHAARLDLYVCCVATGVAGRAFVDELSAITGAAVFASDMPVGTVAGSYLTLECRAGHSAANSELLSLPNMEVIPGLCLAGSFNYGDKVEAKLPTGAFVRSITGGVVGTNALYNEPQGAKGTVVSSIPQRAYYSDAYYYWYQVNWGDGKQLGWTADIALGLAFNQAMGSFNGVTAYSNGYPLYDSGIYNSTGLEWQCVEYVNRYYSSAMGMSLGAGRHAWQFYQDNTPAGLQRFPNGGTTPPAVGDILCFGSSTLGHVAIVRSVGSASVTVIQQNATEDSRDANFAYPMTLSGGTYTVDGTNLGSSYSSYYCQGWLRPAAPLQPPTLIEPAPNAPNVPTTTQFCWSQVPGNQGYRIVVSTNAADLTTNPTVDPGTNGSIVFNKAISQDVTTCTPPAGTLAAGTPYYWEVHARATNYGYWAQASFITAPLSPATLTYSLSPGWNTISFPFTPKGTGGTSHFSDIFSGISSSVLFPYVFYFNDDGAIVPASFSDSTFSAIAKKGYFLYLTGSATKTISGDPVTDNSISLTHANFSLIGVTQATTVPTNTQVLRWVFSLEGDANQPAPIDMVSSSLQPGKGYLVYAFAPTQLLTALPIQSVTSPLPQAQDFRQYSASYYGVGSDFSGTVTVHQDAWPNAPALSNKTVEFGVKPDATDGYDPAYDYPYEVPLPGTLSVYFQESSRLGTDYRANRDVVSWPLTVVSQSAFPEKPDNHNPVTISWTIPASGTLAPGTVLRLLDGTGNVLVDDMRTTTQTTFTVSAAATTRQYTIQASLSTAPLSVTTASLPGGAVGTSYTAQLAATGGTPSYTWSLNPGGGSLPPGLSLTPNGAISGTPSASGTSNFTVRVLDSLSATATKALSIAVSSGTPLAIGGGNLPDGFVGASYAWLLTASGGTPPYVWSVSVGTLPPGLSINEGTGEVTGTSTGTGVFPFTVRVSDSHSTAEKAFTVSIYAGGRAINPCPADKAPNVPIDTALITWTNAPGVTRNDIYFGTNPSPAYQQDWGGNSYPVCLQHGVTYYWRVDAREGTDVITGTTWSFTVEPTPPPPGKACDPVPANEARDVPINQKLSWSNGGGALSYAVYFGTGPSPAYQTSRDSTTFDPGPLSYNTTYTWKVRSDGRFDTTPGDLWTFTTCQAPSGPTYQSRTNDGETPTTSTVYVSKVSLSFTPSTADEWLIFGFCEFKCSNVNCPASVQLLIDGITEGQSTRRPVYSTDYMPFVTAKVKTLTTAPHSVQILFKTSNPNAAAYVRNARICAVRKAALQWSSNARDGGVALTSALTDILPLNWTPAATGNYLVISTAEVSATTTVSTDVRTICNGAMNDEGVIRASDSGDFTTFMSLNYIPNAPAGVAITHKIAAKKVSPDAANHYIRRARIIALRLSNGRFRFAAIGSGTEQSTTQTTFQQALSTTWGQGVNGKWLFLNSARVANSSTSRQTELRVQLNNSVTCADQIMRPKDASDLLNFSSIDIRALTTPRQVDMDYRTTNAAGTATVKRLRFYGLPLDAQ